MKRKLYVETSIIRTLVEEPCDDLEKSVEQSLTHRFFKEERHKYELFVSDYVYEECRQGDAAVVRERLRRLEGIEVLKTTPYVAPLAEAYIQLLGIPEGHKNAAFHLAICSVYKIDIIMAWHRKYLDTFAIGTYNNRYDLHTPIRQTPHELVYTYNPIIAEVRRNRKALLAEFGGDIKKLDAHIESLRPEREAAGFHYETEEKRLARIEWSKQQQEEQLQRIESIGPPRFVE